MKTELIYQDESSNKFWNIVVEGNQHTVTYGRVGTDGTSKTKTFADEATALKDATKLIASKKKKGYVETATKAKIVRDDYTFAGKPIKEFGSSINPDTAVKVLSDYDEEEKVVDKLDKLSKLPNVGEMDTLIIGAWQEAHETSWPPIIDKLIELKDVFSGVKHLFIGDMTGEECEMSWIIQADYREFFQHYQQLETLGVRGGDSLKFGKIDLPNLKNLIVESGGLHWEVIEDIVASNLKGLEHLEIWLGTFDYGRKGEVDILKPILNGDYPNLKYLGLKNYDLQNELAQELNGATILNTIEILDISMGVLKDEGAEALYNNDALLNLKHINCRHHYISSEWQQKLQERFSGQDIDLSEMEEVEEYDDEKYYYVAIGE